MASGDIVNEAILRGRIRRMIQEENVILEKKVDNLWKSLQEFQERIKCLEIEVEFLNEKNDSKL